MDTSRETTVPEWPAGERFHITDESGEYDMIRLGCPRGDCDGFIWVRPSALVARPEMVNTRPCFHCFRAAWLPGLVGVPPATVDAPLKPRPAKRRIVRRRKKGGG